MKLIIVTLLSLFQVLAVAQLIDNQEGSVFSDSPYFNEEFVRNNQIKSITGSFSTKKTMDVIRTRGLEDYYEFDHSGKVVLHYTTYNKGGGTKDTTFINFIRDQKDQLVTKRRNDSYGFFSYNYKYDSLGNIIEKTYCRDENVGPSKKQFKLGKQYIIVEEKFGYSYPDSLTKKKLYYNNYKKVYQTETTTYDKDGYLVSKVMQLKVNGKTSSVQYEYNERGLLSKKTETSNMVKKNETVYEYTYDEYGNLETENLYKNGVHHLLREVIYDKSTMLMSALLSKDIETGIITIVKFKYEFYDGTIVDKKETNQ